MRRVAQALFRAAAPAITVAAVLAVAACSGPPAERQRVIVLGIDGMDYELTRQLIGEGRLPHLATLAEEGIFRPLGTAVPPLSPVAWSNFITGKDSGSHGIYDFMHRDPGTMLPYLSTSQPASEGRTLRLGEWQIPLSGGGYELLRRGRPFWEVLEEHGVETSILRIPANFPVSGSATREISGMGTPDAVGSYGMFSFFTSELFFEKREVSGGELYELDYWDGVARGSLRGPSNPFREDGKRAQVPFSLYVDEEQQAAKLEIGEAQRILRVGEWSDWVPFDIELVPLPMGLTLQSVHGMARFYLRQVVPEVELYVSPINFDPMYGGLPASTPADYASELAEATGRYYTQGMPEDTQALKGEVLTVDEFLAQARIAGRELEEQYRYVLDTFEGGLLFYYFGNLDMVSHMMWGAMDPGNPQYDSEPFRRHREVVVELYERADEIVGHTLERMAEGTTLIVMSDHGFTSWRRTFHLNAWLAQKGYLKMKNPDLKDDPGVFVNVDWAGTRAYGLGLNGLYLNLRGRERTGIVDPSERQSLLDEITAGLLAEIDPDTGRPAVTRVYSRDDYFQDGGAQEIGPDLIVGYAKMTRGSSGSALGETATQVYSDNVDDWSGDHGMDHETVPGVLFATRELRKPARTLTDLAAAIVAEFGVEGFPE